MTSDKTQLSFRPATEEDLVKILEIEKKSYPLPWTEAQFKEELSKPFSHFLVLTDDETDTEIAGYIVYWMLFEEVHILNVTVNLEWRGLGLGQRLIRNAVSDALKKDLKRLFLEVRKSNTAAVALYQKIGFFVDHVKKGFYADGEDAYFMVLFLQQKNTF